MFFHSFDYFIYFFFICENVFATSKCCVYVFLFLFLWYFVINHFLFDNAIFFITVYKISIFFF
ncbi:MAG TPA: hypothetical protein EYG85_07970 [Crocinitomix sp.]|nr:hypothetical protein [Crocinitomix sp.]